MKRIPAQHPASHPALPIGMLLALGNGVGDLVEVDLA